MLDISNVEVPLRAIVVCTYVHLPHTWLLLSIVWGGSATLEISSIANLTIYLAYFRIRILFFAKPTHWFWKNMFGPAGWWKNHVSTYLPTENQISDNEKKFIMKQIIKIMIIGEQFEGCRSPSVCHKNNDLRILFRLRATTTITKIHHESPNDIQSKQTANQL